MGILTATRILAEVIARDASWLMVFNNAIDHVIQHNPKARQNPRGSVFHKLGPVVYCREPGLYPAVCNLVR